MAPRAALAHASGDKIEAAYARGDVLDKWGKLICASIPVPASTNTVVPLRSA
jgi:hypothetical protein